MGGLPFPLKSNGGHTDIKNFPVIRGVVARSIQRLPEVLASAPGSRGCRPSQNCSDLSLRNGSALLASAGQVGRCWFSMYWRTTVSGAPPQLPAKYERDRTCPCMMARLTWPVYS